jgi:hypothetical protein
MRVFLFANTDPFLRHRRFPTPDSCHLFVFFILSTATTSLESHNKKCRPICLPPNARLQSLSNTPLPIFMETREAASVDFITEGCYLLSSRIFIFFKLIENTNSSSFINGMI